MTHEEVRDQLAAYVLGALDDSEMAEVRAHLGACSECRRTHDHDRRVRDSLAGPLAGTAPERLDPGTKAELIRALAPGRRSPRLALVAAAMALALAAAAVVCNARLG